MQRHPRPTALLAVAISCALFPVSQLHAQSASADAVSDDAVELDRVSVTGQRGAQRAAIDSKRDTFAISDSISADDIGKLPDHNTAAALQRVPGISIQEDQGEPRYPVIRGLRPTYNRTTIDGAYVASVEDNDRGVPLDIVPSVMAERVEVTKTATPDQDANAIGGTINVVTRSAFNTGKPFLDFSGSLGRYDRHGEVRNDKQPYRASMAAGTLFGTDDQFGIVVGVSDELLDYDIPQTESADPSVREYTAAGVPVDSGSASGNGIQVPVQRRLFWYNNTKRRTGANAKLEWRPADTFRLDTTLIYSTMEDDEERLEDQLAQSGNVSNQTATSGTFASARSTIGYNHPVNGRTIWLGRSGFQWDASERLTLDGDLVWSKAELDRPTTTYNFRTPVSGDFGFDYDTSDFYPIFTPRDPGAVYDLSRYTPNTLRHTQVRSTDKVNQARFNIEYDNGGLDSFFKLKAGTVLRRTDRDYGQAATNYTLKSGQAFTLDSVAVAGPPDSIYGRYSIPWRVDPSAVQAYLAANADSFNVSFDDVSARYHIVEDVLAGFVQGTYSTGPLTVTGGVRYEHTRVDSDSVRKIDSDYLPVSDQGSYGNWLPSVHVRYDLSERWVLRGAWTNTIGRPDFGDISANSTVSYDGSQPVLSRGNPELNPRKSRGLDLSLEFYPSADALVSLGVFRKDIDNEIFVMSAVQELDLGLGNGVESVLVRQPMNAREARIDGIEAAWQQSLSFLPAPFDGLGFNLNATLLDTDFAFLTSTGLRETGFYLQPDTVLNLMAYYQYGPLEFRVSNNYTGGFLETINDTIPNADQYWKSRRTYDASINWRINQHLSAFVQGQNLSNTGRRELTGPGQHYLQESAEYGRTYWVGLAGHF